MTSDPGDDRLEPRSEDVGLTLVELLVVMLLLGLVGSLVLSTLMTSLGTAVRQQHRNDDVNAVATAMNHLTTHVRSGARVPGAADGLRPIFNVAEPERVDMYTWRGEEPARVVYETRIGADGVREVVESTYPAVPGGGPLWEFETSPGGVRVVARHVAQTGPDEPSLFTYYDRDGAVVTAPEGADTTTRKSISHVQVSLRVENGDRGSDSSAALVNRVYLPNSAVESGEHPESPSGPRTREDQEFWDNWEGGDDEEDEPWEWYS